MKRIINWLPPDVWLAILVGCIVAGRPFVVYAQQPKPLTPAQEAEAAQRQLITAANNLDAAQAAFNVAMANRNAALYKVLAELGIKPSECTGVGQDGKPNPFACVKIDPNGVVSAEKPARKNPNP